MSNNGSVTSESSYAESKYLAYLEQKESTVQEETQQIYKICAKMGHLEMPDDSQLSSKEKQALADMLDAKAAMNLIPTLKEKVYEIEKAQSKLAMKEEKQKARNEKVLRCEMSKHVNQAMDVLNLLSQNKAVQNRLQIAKNGEAKPALTKEELEKLVAFVQQENKLLSVNQSLAGSNVIELSSAFGSKIFLLLTSSKEAVENLDVTYAELNDYYQKVLDSKLLTKIPFKALSTVKTNQGNKNSKSEQAVKSATNSKDVEKPKATDNNGKNVQNSKKKPQGNKKGNNRNGPRSNGEGGNVNSKNGGDRNNGRRKNNGNQQQMRSKREVSR